METYLFASLVRVEFVAWSEYTPRRAFTMGLRISAWGIPGRAIFSTIAGLISSSCPFAEERHLKKSNSKLQSGYQLLDRRRSLVGLFPFPLDFKTLFR
jgi:hypothetical protein